MYGTNNIWEVALQMTDVSNEQVSVLFSLLNDLVQLFGRYWKIVFEHSDRLLAGLYEC